MHLTGSRVLSIHHLNLNVGPSGRGLRHEKRTESGHSSHFPIEVVNSTSIVPEPSYDTLGGLLNIPSIIIVSIK